MINTLSSWGWNLRARRRLAKFESGYEWAAGQLLSGRATPQDLTERLQDGQAGNDAHPFDLGARMALYDWTVRWPYPTKTDSTEAKP